MNQRISDQLDYIGYIYNLFSSHFVHILRPLRIVLGCILVNEHIISAYHVPTTSTSITLQANHFLY